MTTTNTTSPAPSDTTPLEDAEWLEAIIEHIDNVGWATGTSYDAVSHKQCLIGGGGAVEGINYPYDYRGEFDVAKRLAAILDIVPCYTWPNGGHYWMAVGLFNDGHESWSELRTKLVGKIEELRSGSNYS